MTDVTHILAQFDETNPALAKQLFSLVYEELRKLAVVQLAHEKPGQTLQATALVHEAYVRLVGKGGAQQWNGRNHFFVAAAEAMRRILVDSARRKASIKHGGDRAREFIDPSEIATAAPPEEVLAVHEALDQLGAIDPSASELVKLHYFGGFSIEEAAGLLGISRANAYRTWTYARTWLRAALRDPPNSSIVRPSA
jgi:RNA polymerase sigma factor (TIGR02999 family)